MMPEQLSPARRVQRCVARTRLRSWYGFPTRSDNGGGIDLQVIRQAQPHIETAHALSASHMNDSGIIRLRDAKHRLRSRRETHRSAPFILEQGNRLARTKAADLLTEEVWPACQGGTVEQAKANHDMAGKIENSLFCFSLGFTVDG